MQAADKELLKKLYLSMRAGTLKPFCALISERSVHREGVKNILFLRPDRIGDMTLSLPAIKILKQAFRGASLTVLASRSNKDILLNNPCIDEILIYHGLLSYLRQVWPRGFDLVIDPIFTYELKTAFMAFLSLARYRLGFKMAGREIFFNVKKLPLYDDKKDFQSLMSELLHPLLHLLGIESQESQEMLFTRSDEPLIFLTEMEKHRSQKYIKALNLSDKKLIAIHPGGYYPSQRWPLERFVKVAKELAGRRDPGDLGIIFFIPESEFPNFEDSGLNNICAVIKKISLRDFMAILSFCHLFIGNNSGPLHIAAALGLRTVSLMGPTVPDVWRPQGENHYVLRKGYPCSPCNKAVCESHQCMMDITEQEVLAKVYESLGFVTSIIQK